MNQESQCLSPYLCVLQFLYDFREQCCSEYILISINLGICYMKSVNCNVVKRKRSNAEALSPLWEPPSIIRTPDTKPAHFLFLISCYLGVSHISCLENFCSKTGCELGIINRSNASEAVFLQRANVGAENLLNPVSSALCGLFFFTCDI